MPRLPRPANILLSGDVQVAYVAVSQSYALFEFDGREEFPIEYYITEVRRVLRYRVYQMLADCLPRVLPCAPRAVVRARTLTRRTSTCLPSGVSVSSYTVGICMNIIGLLDGLPRLRVIPTLLEVFDRRADASICQRLGVVVPAPDTPRSPAAH